MSQKNWQNDSFAEIIVCTWGGENQVILA